MWWDQQYQVSVPSVDPLITDDIVAASRRLLVTDDKTINQVFEDSKEGLTSIIDSVYGDECMTDRGCATLLAFCDRREGFSGSLGWIFEMLAIKVLLNTSWLRNRWRVPAKYLDLDDHHQHLRLPCHCPCLLPLLWSLLLAPVSLWMQSKKKDSLPTNIWK